MELSKEIQEKINLLFKTDSEMKEKLYECDADTIREIGRISQIGIVPNDIIVAYISDDPSMMKYLYEKAIRLVELQELYRGLCFEYYKKTKENNEHVLKKMIK